MKVTQVLKRVREIVKASENNSMAAHEAEDELYLEVLYSIAEGDCAEPQAHAKAALKTQEVIIVKFY